MQPPGSEGRRNYETIGVFSPDGEYLPFVAPIVTEGRPEEWLNTVEEAMFAATKRHLYRVTAPIWNLLRRHEPSKVCICILRSRTHVCMLGIATRYVSLSLCSFDKPSRSHLSSSLIASSNPGQPASQPRLSTA